MAGTRPSCFKAYDIRGRVPDELDADLAYRVGLAAARFLGARSFCVGHDCRLTSRGLAEAVIRGVCDAGCDVLDIGLCGTEMVYWATDRRRLDGGIMVTASHNPMDYNGMKLVRDAARPISGDSGLDEIGDLATGGALAVAPNRGRVSREEIQEAYVADLLAMVDVAGLAPLTIVADGGNGCAGPVVRALAAEVPGRWHHLHETPDGTFPSGIPNPLLPENRAATAEAVRRHGADLGLAWDGDFDRCFFFDERGDFVEGYYLVGLLARAALRDEPGGRIVHDPRLVWNTIEVVRAAGGIPLMNKTGHAFMKERMRAETAVYGGEMSAHHYFRGFAYCDSGMLPWLYVLQEITTSRRTLSQLVGAMQAAFPASGEINRRLADPAGALARIEARYAGAAVAVDRTDGLSCEFADWRFNLRQSNTEPLLRLNVESRGDAALMRRRTAEILKVLDA
ncbi:MAG TPA: phosphomannomutase [Candidatus Krumholzibacteria bacterium]|nr:phosphomannomutase [Candidatus Krumholzibacteria bacterium]HPD70755.1 phosphomannomutase [Candidatus Krumholzibacteria bacterium]HRY39545.1 phosphomannomutase [Candidatus Krumholzibacteria bacterium]